MIRHSSVNRQMTVFLVMILLNFSFGIGQEAALGTWFSETYPQGGYACAFGGRSAISIINDNDRKRGKVIKLEFDDKEYPGAEIGLGTSEIVDLGSVRKSGALRFFIRGSQGGEKMVIGLMDRGNDGKNKCEVKVQSFNFFKITDKWQQVIIPLISFSDEGERWYTELKGGEYARIDWSKIYNIRFSAIKEQNIGRSVNRIATIFIDDIEIISHTADLAQPPFLSWRHLEDKTSGPFIAEEDTSNLIFSFFGRSMAKKTSVYTYEGRTDFSVKDAIDSSRLPLIVCYFDDAEWSGVTLHKAQKEPIDVSAYRETGGLEFKIKGAAGGELFIIGLLDDESEGTDMKVQTRLPSRVYTKVSTEWQTVQIPFSDFTDIGKWWSTDGHNEVLGNMDWTKLTEVRISTEKLANRIISQNGEKPVRLYLSDIKLVKKMETHSMSRFWKEFKSNAPDILVDDFEEPEDTTRWISGFCPYSTVKVSTDINPDNNSKAVRIDYRIDKWGSSTNLIDSADTVKSNWSYHNALKFNFFSNEKVQTCMVMIVDGSNEAWFAHFEALKGWQEITVPFSEFRMYEFWQPEDVQINRKMDMEKIHSYDFRPGVFGKKGTIMLDNVRLTNTFIPVVSETETLRFNQVGYFQNAVKRFMVTDSSVNDFAVIDEQGAIVRNGKFFPGSFWPLSGEYIKIGDFTDIKKPGRYQILIQETGEKGDVFIRENAYSDALNAAVKAFYYQRLSTELKKEHAGAWIRKSGMADTACPLHTSTGKSGVKNVSGGWMDAGDYGKYIINAGITVGSMLSLYELYPDLIGDNLNIPESRNGKSDLLDEIRFELEWMKRMQDSDGGVFFKVGSLQWDGFSTPEETKSVRYVIGKSTSSALNFAAVMAMAARIYKDDKKFSKDCLKRSTAAWKWAINNPDIREPNEVGGTGAYEDAHFGDEFFWAACELFVTTGKGSFKKHIEQNASSYLLKNAAGWSNVSNLGYYTLVKHFHVDKYPFVSDGSRSIINLADRFVKNIDSIPCRIPVQDFAWGSNSVLLNHAVVMCYAYHLTKQEKYLESVIETVDYVFGKNATGFCFVTGFGKKSPLQPHHRIMAADGVEAPFPGFVVGGPNADRQDEISGEPGVHYPDKEPAKAYIDRMAAYACNEVAINWNAALVFVLGFLCANAE